MCDPENRIEPNASLIRVCHPLAGRPEGRDASRAHLCQLECNYIERVNPLGSVDLSIDIAAVTFVLRAFFEGSSADTVFVGGVPKPDGHLDWIDEMLTRSEPHDPDYRIFGKLRDPSSTIIDVGAHYGYSAASIWAVGSTTCVLSFEPTEA